MTRPDFLAVLATLLRELVDGAPDPATRTFMLNRGDPGLLASLDRLGATEASATRDGAPSIAAHVDHLRYGLSLLKGWAAGNPPRSADTDWTASWKRSTVSDDEWRALREALHREARTWAVSLGTVRVTSEIEAGWIVGSVAHFAYHLGAIRQLDRALCGPTAEDEARVERALGKR